MPSVGTASLDILADRQQVGRSISGAIESQGNLVGGLGRKLGGLLFGGFAAVQGISFLKGAIDESREAEKVQRQTNAVLASTKGAANIGASGIGDLADKLSGLAGVDDELIQ